MRKTHRKGLILAVTAAASIAAVNPAFASGWSQNSQGWWYATSVDGTSWYSNGWQWIDGNGDGIAECYYFDADGYMLANTITPDGYTVDTNGGWIQNGVIQTRTYAGLSGNTASNAITAQTATTATAESAVNTETSSGQRASNVIVANNSSVYGADTSSAESTSTTSSDSSSGSSKNWTYRTINLETGEITYPWEKTESEEDEKDFSSYARECFDLINKKRTANGLDELEWDDSVAEACNTRAAELAEKFSHTRPDGTICSTALDEAGVEYSAFGENIAYGQFTPEDAVNAWMRSKAHKANIMKESYTHSAVGFYYDASATDKYYKYYWVQMFVRLK